MSDGQSFRNFDWVLLACMVLLVGYGILMISQRTFQTQKLRPVPQTTRMAAARRRAVHRDHQYRLSLLTRFFAVVLHFFAYSSGCRSSFFRKRISGAEKLFVLGHFTFNPRKLQKSPRSSFCSITSARKAAIRNLVFRDFVHGRAHHGHPHGSDHPSTRHGTTITFLPPLVL